MLRIRRTLRLHQTLRVRQSLRIGHMLRSLLPRKHIYKLVSKIGISGSRLTPDPIDDFMDFVIKKS